MGHNYKKGSIISYKDENIQTISVVSKVKGDYLYCNNPICSLDGGETWILATRYLRKYEGEEVCPELSLCDTKEFDIIIDTNLIPREVLVDVSL